MHIAIAGNIGAGKTTLTQLLAKHYKWEAQLEDVVDNPYLDDFYNQMERWSFNLQVYFLNSRFRQVMQIRKSGRASGAGHPSWTPAFASPSLRACPRSCTA